VHSECDKKNSRKNIWLQLWNSGTHCQLHAMKEMMTGACKYVEGCNTADLVADETVYHVTCRYQFVHKQGKVSGKAKRDGPMDEHAYLAFQKVCRELGKSCECGLLTLNDLHDMMKYLLGPFNNYVSHFWSFLTLPCHILSHLADPQIIMSDPNTPPPLPHCPPQTIMCRNATASPN
jgi:hypothetical protein